MFQSPLGFLLFQTYVVLPLCDAAAKEKRPAWTEKRLAYGAQCSWTERVHQMEEVLYKKGVLHESAEE